jgi:small redox-active disulfide protein 2
MNSIKVLGTGCPTCKRLLSEVETLVEEKSWQAEVEYITDIPEILGYGVLTTPALVVNEKVAFAGYPGKPKLENLLSDLLV